MEFVTIKSNCDNLPLELSIEIPETDRKGIVQISHGMAEHKERYYPFIKFLKSQGYIVVIHDHRGHGKSIKHPEDQGYFYDTTANYIVEDLYQITEYMKKKYPNLKITLFGHSMGSLVVRKYLQKYDAEINALIVCGSPSKNPWINIALGIVKIEKLFYSDKHRSKMIQSLAFGSFDKPFKNQLPNSWICQNASVVSAYNEDPKCGFIFTLNGFQNLFRLMKEVYQKKRYGLKNPTLPILFIAGSDDPVIMSEKKWKKSQKLLKEVGYTNIESRLYDKMRHEILNELEKQVVYQDIIEWMEKMEIEIKNQ